MNQEIIEKSKKNPNGIQPEVLNTRDSALFVGMSAPTFNDLVKRGVFHPILIPTSNGSYTMKRFTKTQLLNDLQALASPKEIA